ncbi:MAG: sugar ABC transporter substrate-binding protein [Alkalibacterium sp.]|nr:sugar ABC transporter substrate-binding protein [Alkalibacterium sp.]
MNKLLSLFALLTLSVLGYLTYVSAESIINTEWHEPLPLSRENQHYRLVLISQDSDTPFWNSVAKGAVERAEQEGVMLEVLNNYGKNDEVFLSNLELGIHSRVDGIIVQGLDEEAFKELTKVKAAFYSIPIITIGEDVPMEESLRRTYVGSDHFLAGKLIAQQLIADMGETGEVAILLDENTHYYQTLRMEGIESILKLYPDITLIKVPTDPSKDKVMATTQNLLNQYPDIEGFIAVNADAASGMIQEISRRKQIAPLYNYSFDDHADIDSLMQQGKLDAIVAQDPEKMGNWGVGLLIEWLEGETVPLDFDGYFTPVRIRESQDGL